MSTRALALFLLAATASCKRGEPPPPAPVAECGPFAGGKSCGPWQKCVSDSCGPDGRNPAPPVLEALALRDKQLLVKGSAEPGTSVAVYWFTECRDEAGRVAAAQLASGLLLPLADALQRYRSDDPSSLRLSATALSPHGHASPCADIPALPPAPPPPPDPDWWKTAFDSADAASGWWRELRARQVKYLGEMPAALGAALASAQEFVPLAELNSGYGAGDYNCDGAVDYAVVGLGRSSPLAKALAAPSDPGLAELGLLWKELQRFKNDVAAEVRIALSKPGGFSLAAEAGSTVRNSGPFPENGQKGCGGPPEEFDLAWARAHSCDVLAVGCCEKDGIYLAWDRKLKRLVSVGGC